MAADSPIGLSFGVAAIDPIRIHGNDKLFPRFFLQIQNVFVKEHIPIRNNHIRTRIAKMIKGMF